MIALVAVAMLGAWWIAILLGRVWWVFELASHFMLPFLVCAAILHLLCLWMRLWRFAVIAAVLFIWAGLQVGPYLIRGRSEQAAGKQSYRFVLLNLLQDNRETQAVVDFIESESPDVLMLQETTPRWVRELRGTIGKQYPFQVLEARSNPFGMWLLSKYPLSGTQVLPSADAKIPFLKTSIDLDGRKLNFVTVHPRAPTGQSKARARDARLAEAGELIGQKQGARMLLGDLNCSPWSPYFRQLLRDGELRDSGRWCGWSPTWTRGISWLRIPIDHCLVSEEIGVARREIGPDVGSDHRGLVVDVFFR